MGLEGAEAGNDPGAIPTGPCLAQLHPPLSEHREPYEVQNEGAAVRIPRVGELGLAMGRMRGRSPSRCWKGPG